MRPGVSNAHTHDRVGWVCIDFYIPSNRNKENDRVASFVNRA